MNSKDQLMVFLTFDYLVASSRQVALTKLVVQVKITLQTHGRIPQDCFTHTVVCVREYTGEDFLRMNINYI